MWVHVLSVLGLVALPIVWWVLQRANGGEKLPDCGGHEGGACASCGSKAGCDTVGHTEAHTPRG